MVSDQCWHNNMHNRKLQKYMEAVIFGKSCEYRFLANCRDLPCFCDFTRHLLLKVNCNFFCDFSTTNHSVQIYCCTFHMFCYLLTLQSACLCLFHDSDVTVISFTLQSFSCCLCCRLFFVGDVYRVS